jgi:hypothetical protein
MAELTDPRRSHPAPDDLKLALRQLGERLDYPDDANILPAVRARLAAAPPSRRRSWSGWKLVANRGFAYAALALAVIAAVVLAVSPGARTTIADRIGLPGIDISTGDTPEVGPGGELRLGVETELADARERAGFTLLAPPAIGAPDAIYLDTSLGGPRVSYVYAPDGALPEVADTGVGLLVMQFAGRTNESFIQKQLGAESAVEPVIVGDYPGFWISGAPHVFYFQDPTGAIHEETIRLTGNVLLWHDGKRTVRIESALDRDAALRLAESMTDS